MAKKVERTTRIIKEKIDGKELTVEVIYKDGVEQKRNIVDPAWTPSYPSDITLSYIRNFCESKGKEGLLWYKEEVEPITIPIVKRNPDTGNYEHIGEKKTYKSPTKIRDDFIKLLKDKYGITITNKKTTKEKEIDWVNRKLAELEDKEPKAKVKDTNK